MKRRFVHQPPLTVPAGFSGWWCQHCDKPATGIPEDLDAAQSRCPRCHKWTAIWIPGARQEAMGHGETGETERPLARRQRGAQWFALMRAQLAGETTAQTPEEYEHEQATR